MRKIIFYIFLSLVLTSCKKSEEPRIHYKSDSEIRREIQRHNQDLIKFEGQLNELYAESEKAPRPVLRKADSLILINNQKQNTLHDIAVNKATELYYLKAGIYYRLGKYAESIETLNKVKSKQGPIALGLIANYIKIQQPKKAALLVDHLGEGIRQEFAKGNYYECTGNVGEAMKNYQSVISYGKQEGYKYYELSMIRIKELKKVKPVLLSELYFPDGKIAYHT